MHLLSPISALFIITLALAAYLWAFVNRFRFFALKTSLGALLMVLSAWVCFLDRPPAMWRFGLPGLFFAVMFLFSLHKDRMAAQNEPGLIRVRPLT